MEEKGRVVRYGKVILFGLIAIMVALPYIPFPIANLVAKIYFCFMATFVAFVFMRIYEEKRDKLVLDIIRGRKIIITGPAGSGKDYLRNIFHNHEYAVDVSYTTRPRRDGEVNGYDYHFIDGRQFSTMLNKGKLFELTMFNGASYAISKKSWETSRVFIMAPMSVKRLPKRELEDTLIIYLDVSEKFRRERFLARKDQGFDDVERRLEADKFDFMGFEKIADVTIKNPIFSLEDVLLEIKKIS